MVKDIKIEFLRQIILSNVQSASFQHASVYAPNIQEKERLAFQSRFRQELSALEQFYHAPVSDDEHIMTIVSFANTLSEQFPHVLKDGRMRIGIAQKAINLYLKFLWCLELVPEPPHCPLDNLVLSKLRERVSWTKLDGIENYCKKIGELKKVAGELSLSQWECKLWNEQINKS